MPLDKDERLSLEETIIDAQIASEKFLQTGKDAHKRYLETTVEEAAATLQMLADKLKDDDKTENYKLHLFVPFQLAEYINLDNE